MADAEKAEGGFYAPWVVNGVMHWSVSPGTALAGSDYVPSSGTISAGNTRVYTQPYPIIDDKIYEGTEYFNYRLDGGISESGRYLIRDDNDLPKINIATEQLILEEGGNTASIRFELSNLSVIPVKIRANISPTNYSGDLELLQTEITIPANELFVEIPFLKAKGDNLIERIESGRINFTGSVVDPFDRSEKTLQFAGPSSVDLNVRDAYISETSIAEIQRGISESSLYIDALSTKISFDVIVDPKNSANTVFSTKLALVGKALSGAAISVEFVDNISAADLKTKGSRAHADAIYNAYESAAVDSINSFLVSPAIAAAAGVAGAQAAFNLGFALSLVAGAGIGASAAFVAAPLLVIGAGFAAPYVYEELASANVKKGIKSIIETILPREIFYQNYEESTKALQPPPGNERPPTQQPLSGGPQNDDVVASAASDVLTGGSGQDWFSGTLGELNGDRIADYEASETILVKGSFFGHDAITLSRGSTVISIDANRDGVVDSSFKLDVDLSALRSAGLELTVRTLTDGTAISFEPRSVPFVSIDRGAINSREPATAFVDAAKATQYRVVGTKRDDRVAATDFNDLLEMGVGNDRAAGRGGDDFILGGDGIDTAVFQGKRSEYAVSKQADGSTRVQDTMANRDDIDTLVDVENLQFANVPTFRFFHTQAGGHLFTTSAAEAASVRANLPVYRDEGTTFLTADEGLAGAVPVYRFFHTQAGGHLFTTSAVEAASVRANLPVYRDEGIALHMSATPGEGLAPIYRFFHTQAGGHLFTASQTEAASVRANLPVYRDESIAFYAPTSVADAIFGF